MFSCAVRPIFCVMSAMLAATVAQAQDVSAINRRMLDSWLGTVTANFRPMFSGASLSGCTIEFATVVRDWAYRQGDYVKVDGAFGFMSMEGIVAPVLKVVVNDIDHAVVGLALSPSPPTSAFIVQDYTSNASELLDAYQSDTPGALFSVFNGEGTVSMFFEALISGQLVMHFSRTSSGMSVPVPIDLTVEDTGPDGQRRHSNRAIDAMLGCLDPLLAQIPE